MLEMRFEHNFDSLSSPIISFLDLLQFEVEHSFGLSVFLLLCIPMPAHWMAQ